MPEKSKIPSRLGICQIFYTSKIPNFLNYTREKRVDRNIFGNTLRIEDVLVIYFEEHVSICAIIYSNTNSLKVFHENSGVNLANFTDRVIALIHIQGVV